MLHTSARQIAAALCFFCLTPASAALAQSDENPIVVTGRTPEATQRFVDQLAAAAPTADQLPRWNNALCTRIAGLPARQGQYVADRIAQRAAAVGLSPGQSGCAPNVTIVVTDDADATARRMHEESATLFAARRENNITTMGPAAFEAFLDNDRPVRWWHVAQTMGADGLNLDGDTSTGGLQNAPVARSGGSRLYADTREDLNRAIIIIDSRRVGNVQLSALADYIAMVTLAQINPQADTSGYSSILNLFSGEAGLTQMTDWDVAFLSALYRSSRSASTPQQQRNEVARRMRGAA